MKFKLAVPFLAMYLFFLLCLAGIAKSATPPGGIGTHSWPSTAPTIAAKVKVNGKLMYCQRWAFTNGYIDRCVVIARKGAPATHAPQPALLAPPVPAPLAALWWNPEASIASPRRRHRA